MGRYSTVAKDIIRNLLQDDTVKRLTATELKNHAWVTGKEAPQHAITNDIHKTIKDFMTLSKLGTKNAGDRNRRVSIYGLFNIAREKNNGAGMIPVSVPVPVPAAKGKGTKPVSGTPLAPITETPKENTEAEMIRNIKNQLWSHLKGFNKIKDVALQLSNTTKNESFKEQIRVYLEELDFLNNEYKTLLDSIGPKLRQAHQIAVSGYGQKILNK
jgi:serine/threonine protein kinase